MTTIESPTRIAPVTVTQAMIPSSLNHFLAISSSSNWSTLIILCEGFAIP